MIAGGYCSKTDLTISCICLKVLAESREVALIANPRLISVGLAGSTNQISKREKKSQYIFTQMELAKLAQSVHASFSTNERHEQSKNTYAR